MRKIFYLLVAFSLTMGSCDEIPAGVEQEGNQNTEQEQPGQEKPEEEQPGLDQVGSGETDGYTLVWQDLFDGDALDETVWNIEVNGNGGGNNELQYYRRENVSVGKDEASGCNALILTAKREKYSNKEFTSGRINSKNKKAFKYGKIEASIKLPKTANGLWPAFWLMGNDYDQVGWPRCGEIDILEMGNSNGIKNNTQDRYFNGACHWGFYKDGAYPNYAKASTWSYSLQDDQYHLYTMIWDEKKISMYVDMDKYPDAKAYYEMGVTGDDSDWSVAKYFHHDFFILFNLAVGGNFPGIHKASGITAIPEDGSASMYVDFVKVYQKQ